jgi:xanthine dehydrogenase accessory factor
MAINEAGGIVGSVSGGCVEGAVVSAARKVIRSGEPQRLHFGVSNEDAWEVGLACGGEIDIFLQPANKQLMDQVLPRLKAEQESILSTVVNGPKLGAQELTDTKGRELYSSQAGIATAALNGNKQPHVVTQGESQVLVTPLLASPTLMMIGGAHISIALAKLANTLGFRSVVIDPRKAFGSPERFAHADQLVQAWPQQAFEQVPLATNTAVASLSHDPKIDDPALIAALNSDAFYVGALGSTRNAEKRRVRLLEAGVSEEQLARLHGPIGLEINAETPEEIALAIMAQVIDAYRS